MSTSAAPAQQREFVQAAVVTDLPNEIMSALQQGLAQFGINLPPLPTGLSPSGAQPVTGSTLTSPLSPVTSVSPSLATPPLGATGTGLGTTGTGLGDLPAAGVTSPTTGLPDATAVNPALTTGLPDTSLTSPSGLPVGTSGLTPVATDPALGGLGTTSTGLLPTEQPISAPIGLDSLGATYPIDPSLAGYGTMPTSTGGGGLISDLSSAANQMGVGQAIDLLKGIVMPSITSAIQSAGAAQGAAAPAVAAAPAG